MKPNFFPQYQFHHRFCLIIHPIPQSFTIKQVPPYHDVTFGSCILVLRRGNAPLNGVFTIVERTVVLTEIRHQSPEKVGLDCRILQGHLDKAGQIQHIKLARLDQNIHPSYVTFTFQCVTVTNDGSNEHGVPFRWSFNEDTGFWAQI